MLHSFLILLGFCAVNASPPDINLVPIPAASFTMGESEPTTPDTAGPPGFPAGDYDEHPVHTVTLSAFNISAQEITGAQFKAFQPDYAGDPAAPATGVTWHEAQAFCDWLSVQQGKPYRLPTEAEWEYVAKTHPDGITSLDQDPAEWCWDWYGPYAIAAGKDPAGPGDGFTKVVRGGAPSLYENQEVSLASAYYHRPANRASAAPSYPPKHLDASLATQRFGNIGFRVVQAPPPVHYTSPQRCFAQYGIKATESLAQQGPDSAKPFFRRRALLPIPPDNTPVEEYADLFPGVLPHLHSPAVVACDNGDLLVSFFCSTKSSTEYWPNVAFTLQRLRYGAIDWDLPEVFFDFADVPEETPLFFKDGKRIWYITGGVGLPGVPFKWISSGDNGATWSSVQFPVFETPIGPHTEQPINSAFRDAQGYVYIPSDGEGGTSVLWRGLPDLSHWRDEGGRTGGRHTTFALLKNGGILGMGGKSTDIDGYMPKSISMDAGKTWTVSKTPFPSLAYNQRPSLLRLKSGRLFFAGDYQRNSDASKPEAIQENGAYVALSDDDGETWHIKPLLLAQPHEKNFFRDREGWGGPTHEFATLGYCVATQSSDNTIHLITSMNQPNLHFAMNEAWILDPAAEGPTASPAAPPPNVQTFQDLTPAGKLKAEYAGYRNEQGEFLLHGPEEWFDEGGRSYYSASWRFGAKAGREVFQPGALRWEWGHGGKRKELQTWRQFWPDGTLRSESSWQRSEGVLRRAP